MLDRIGNVETVGKALDKDAEAGRASATSLLGLDGAARQASMLQNACEKALVGFGAKAKPLREIARFAANRMH
jgi:farnesyl diphosphate synthase